MLQICGQILHHFLDRYISYSCAITIAGVLLNNVNNIFINALAVLFLGHFCCEWSDSLSINMLLDKG